MCACCVCVCVRACVRACYSGYILGLCNHVCVCVRLCCMCVCGWIKLHPRSHSEFRMICMFAYNTITLNNFVFTHIDIATNYVDALQMMCVQLTVVTIISTIFALCFEPQGWFWHHILLFLPWMFFLGMCVRLCDVCVCVCGVCACAWFCE